MQNRIIQYTSMSCWETIKEYFNSVKKYISPPYESQTQTSSISMRMIYGFMSRRGFTNYGTIRTYISYLKKSNYLRSFRHGYVTPIREIEIDLSIEEAKNPLSRVVWDYGVERFTVSDSSEWVIEDGESLSASSSSASSSSASGTSKPEEFIEESEMIL